MTAAAEDLQFVANDIGACVARVDRRGRYLFVNRAYEAAFGLPARRILGMSIRDLLGPEAYRLAAPQLRAALAGRRTSCDRKLPRPGGGFIWWKVVYSPDRGPDRTVRGASIVAVDITERKELEESLRERELQLRLIADNMPALLSFFDRNERYQFVNGRYGEAFGWRPDEIVGMRVRELLGEKAYAVVRPHVRKALSGTPTSYEVQVPVTRGGPRWWRVSLAPEEGPDGEVKGVFVLAVEITEFKEARDRLSQVIESAPDGMLLADAKGRIAMVNHAMEKLFGWPRQKLLGRAVETLIPSALRRKHAGLRRGYMGSPVHLSSAARPSLSGLRRDGTAFPIEIGLNTIRLDGKDMVLASVVDASDRLHAQELELWKARESVQKDYLANAAHELATPVTAMKLAAQLLQHSADDPAIRKDCIQVIESQGVHLSRLVDDLLQLSTLETRHGRGPTRPIDLAVQARREFAAIGPLAKKKGVRCVVAAPARLRVKMDPADLGRILQHLFENGIEYNRPGGRLEFGARREGDRAHVLVRDTGVGIPRKQQPRIFDRFFRTDLGRRLKPKGTGLGLPIVKAAVEAYGGRIRLESQPRKGTAFHLDLPLA